MPALPPFDQYGNLPRGIYLITAEEVIKCFGTATLRRRWLGGRLSRIFELLRSTGAVERIILWGSFVTAKKDPADLDLLLIMKPIFNRTLLKGEVALLFDYTQARLHFHADLFWVTSAIGHEAIQWFIETYQLAKDRRWRGIVEVAL